MIISDLIKYALWLMIGISVITFAYILEDVEQTANYLYDTLLYLSGTYCTYLLVYDIELERWRENDR